MKNITFLIPRKKIFLGIILTVLSLSFVEAQVKVTGKVSEESGEPLIGVNILVKGTGTGTITDINGDFVLDLPSGDAVLVISYTGYEGIEEALNGRTQLEIVMKVNTTSLEEIIVVGYGTVKKKDLTGAVSQIDASKIAHQSPNSVTDILRANVPGLNVGFSNSPKGVSELEVRGKNTLTAGSSPLIVVDGMIYNGDLSDINPSDIDKIDIMKDASSAAVYGARGSNGVVLITTKRGEGSAPTISLSSSFGVATNAIVHKPYDPDGYAAWRTDVFKSINVNHAATPGKFDNPNNLPAGVTLEQWLAYDGAQGDPTTAWLNRIGFQDVEIGNYLAGKSVDWYDQIFQAGLRNEHTLSLAGTKNEVKYYWSIGRTDNEGIIQGEQFTTVRSRLNIESKINNWMTVGANAQFADRDESSVPVEWNMVTQASPWGSELSDDGTTLRFSPQDDPGAGARHPHLRRRYTDRLQKFNTLNTRIYSTIALPLGFSYQFAFANRFEWNDFFNHQSSQSPEWATGTAFRQHTKIQEWQIDNVLKWNKTIGNHSIDATFLAYAEKFNYFRDRTTSGIFDPSDALGYNNLSLGTAITLTGDASLNLGDEQSTGDALMGRINYGYKSKYLISGTMRRDGYSAFGENNRRATFPSVAVGWVLSEEEFFKSDLVDFLKLRVSWGENGNRNIGRYASLSQLVAGKNLIVNGSGTVQTVSTLSNTTMENADLKWERTTAWNFGLDFSLLSGKVDGSIEYYDMITNDLLVSRALPNVIGFSSVFTNLGEVQNKGVELSLSTRNINRTAFGWNSMFNFSLNRNKINSLYGDLDENGKELDDITNRWFIGHAIDEIWGLNVLGIYKTSEADVASNFGVFPGDYKLEDKNNDGVYTVDDNEFLGFSTPRFRWTFVNNFRLGRDIDFSVELYSQWGQKREFNLAKNRNGFVDRTNSLQTPYWTPENQLDDYARLFSSDGSASFNIYRKGSFVRLQNVTLSYTLPSALLTKMTVKSLRVYANIRNVGVWAPDWDLYDPEASEVDGTAGLVPSPRYFTFGLNLTL
ncbi:MAG: SusC/RagA family TonB-linked outer membrane protein [Saprospiraceae bacterium]